MSQQNLGINLEDVNGILDTHILKDGLNMVFDFEESKGCYVYDKLSKKYYLDCFGQFASLPLGYNHIKLLKNASLLQHAAECKIVNSDLYSEEMASFVKTLFDKTMPSQFTKAFFIEGGSNAVENCLKIAFDWKARKKGLSDRDAQKLDVVHLKDAFHGRGGYTLSITNTSPDKTDFFPRFSWTRVANPFIHGNENVELDESLSLTSMENALQNGNVACVIMEVVQGEGGNNLFRKEFLQQVRAVCDKHDTLLIFDEVQNGFGASGKWWSFENYDVYPDLFAFGKKSQVCGVAVNMSKLDEVPENCFRTSSRINSTWGGNIVDMVRSKLIIDIIEEDCLLDKVNEVSQYFLDNLKDIEESGKIKHVRGLGSLIAFDLETTKERNDMLNKLNEHMIVLGCGQKSIRFRPALTFESSHVNEVIDYIKRCL